MIIFNKIRYKNILSTGNNFVEIDLNSNHKTLFLGESGSGKSTFLDAITFVLFNRPFRNITKGQLVNSINGKNLLVECEFTINSKNYMIRRGISPNVFEIYLNDELINQESHSKDYQDILEKQILKFNFKSFSQIVVLGAANFVPFMQLKPADRRVIIENLLDIEIFSTMSLLLKEKISTNKDVLSTIESELNVEKNRLSSHRKYMEELKKNNAEIIVSNLEKIKENEALIIGYEQALDKIQILIKEKETELSDKLEIQSHITKLNSVISNLNSNKSVLNKEVNFYKNNDNCPTCNQLIDINFKENKIKESDEKLVTVEKTLEKSKGVLEKFSNKFLNKLEIEKELNKIKNDMYSCKANISSSQSYIKKLKEENSELEKRNSTKDERVLIEEKNILNSISSIENDKDSALKEKEILSCIVKLLKDDGVKSRIIKQYLPLMKQYTNKFLLSMNFFVDFSLDEEFNEQIVAKGKQNFSYSNFSEGEKQRIDLALLFTWRTIAKQKNSINTNLLILDEILDSYLDNSATDNVIQMLNSEMLKGANIFVISHKDTISDKFSRTIKFSKKNNYSEVEFL